MCGIIGTIWGSHMGSSGDHSTMIAHAHFNLLGWVGMAVMGGFYALAGARVPPWISWSNFGLQATGTVSLSVAMFYLFGVGGGDFVPLVILGSVSSILSMLSFLAAVLIAWRNTVRESRH